MEQCLEVSSFWKMIFQLFNSLILFFSFTYLFTSTKNSVTNYLLLFISLLLHFYLLIFICTVHQPLQNNYLTLQIPKLPFFSCKVFLYSLLCHVWNQILNDWTETLLLKCLSTRKGIFILKKHIKYKDVSDKSNVNLGKTAPELSKSSQAADQFGSLIFRSIHKHPNANKNISY